MGVVVPKLGLLRVGEDLSYSAIMAMLEPVERQLQRKVNPTLYSPAEFAEQLGCGAEFSKQSDQSVTVFVGGLQNIPVLLLCCEGVAH